MHPVLIVALLAFAVIAISYWCAHLWPDNSHTLPAWVQAVGSIAAIIGAFLMADQQLSESRASEARLRALDEIRRLEIIKTVVSNFNLHTRHADQEIRKPTSDANTAMTIFNVLNNDSVAILALPIMEYPSADVAATVVSLPNQIQTFFALLNLKATQAKKTMEQEDRDNIDAVLRHMIAVSDSAISECDKQIAVRKAGISVDKLSAISTSEL